MPDTNGNVNDNTPNVAEDGSVILDAEVVETEDVAKLKETNKRLFERAKKAEGFVKAEDGTWVKKTKPEPVAQTPAPSNSSTNQDTLSRDEAILIAQGMTPDDLDELKAVAVAKKMSLLKAKETPLFQAYLNEQEAARKKEKARLSASSGSQQTVVKDPSSMTKEEHQKWAKEMAKNISV